MTRVTPLLSEAECRLEDFAAIVEVKTEPAQYPLSSEVIDGIVVYHSELLSDLTADGERYRTLQAEVVDALLDGPGIVVFRDAVHPDAVDEASNQFFAIVEDERSANRSAGDHFAKPGANDRIWNALEKLARRDPDLFTRYYQSPTIAFVSQAWLGPNYQMTSQVNIVNPGGEAQQPHRDYHLGFMSNATAGQFPAHVHRLSPMLTLQGAIAHVDMPVETGPTLYLPHSQKYELGYLAWRQSAFADYFASHRVQLPLEKGDSVFFNPALFHAAGTNRTTDVRRIANLLQVSSAMGRSMERVDRTEIVLAIYPYLRRMVRGDLNNDRHNEQEHKQGNEQGALHALACAAEGYAFPADLDIDQPIDGLSPPSQADLVLAALREDWSVDQLEALLR